MLLFIDFNKKQHLCLLLCTDIMTRTDVMARKPIEN